MNEDDYEDEYDLPDDESDVTEYGYTSNLWLAKAMIYMADEMDLKYAVAALFDHMHKIATSTIDVELVRETLVQVTATGLPTVFVGLAKEQITEEEIAAFEAQMRGTPTAEKPKEDGEEQDGNM